jgi:hypothetical protein
MTSWKILFCLLFFTASLRAQVEIWSKYELTFRSSKAMENPLYELRDFHAVFTSPSGRDIQISGFWDGGQVFKIRFAPDETGLWSYRTQCSDTLNRGLHGLEGQFNCIPHSSSHLVYQKGSIKHSRGDYYLTYADGTPFFYVACTAWNGALKATDDEWDRYLSQRARNHYNVIQFVTTQWRGGSKDRMGEVAFTGSGKIALNPTFFQRLDKRVDEINEHGLIAAPVLLWALPFGEGRELSPGYYLPENEAILLAKYLVSRYGGNQVIWILGGDGRYVDEYEQRWKRIGREVFSGEHPGVVAQHPHGISWIGEVYKDEEWLDIVGYQSSHSNGERTVNWINKGDIVKTWHQLPPKPIINLEPNYEEINFSITSDDVRNASYWSVFAAPPSGITYGANGVWPWIQRAGELVENHRNPGGRGPSTWEESIEFPGSKQIGYLAEIINQLEWWKLKPRHDLLVHQPGDEVYNHFISIAADNQLNLITAYTPVQQKIMIRNTRAAVYEITWFDPVLNNYVRVGETGSGSIELLPPSTQDYVLILRKK